VLAQIKIALAARGRLDILVECTKRHFVEGKAWIAASLFLELVRKGRLDVIFCFCTFLQDPAGMLAMLGM